MRDHEYPIQRVIDSLAENVLAVRAEHAGFGDIDYESDAYEELQSRVAELTYLVKHSADGESLGVESVTALIAYGGPTETVTFTQNNDETYGAEVWSSWAPDSPGRVPFDVAQVLADVWGVSSIFENNDNTMQHDAMQHDDCRECGTWWGGE